jgi:uncharacterized delta-60 repeat protein
MNKCKLLSIAGLLAIGLTFGVNLMQAQSIGGRGAGSLDSSFGTNGTVTTRLGVSVAPVAAIEQSNGNIVVVAGINNDQTGVFDFGLLVYTSNGTMIGLTRVAFGSNPNNIPIAAVVEPNGDIIVAGTSAPAGIVAEDFALARFTPNGQLDPTFGEGGLVTTSFTNPCCETGFMTFSSLVLQPNGQIVVDGSAPPGRRNSPGMMVLARYNSNGSLDTTFGTGGIVEQIPPPVNPAALALLANGSYLAEGGPGSAAEFSSTGVLQSTVTPGTVVAASQPTAASLMVFQANGDYVLAQTVGNGFQKSAVEVFRFSETGVADPSFSSFKFNFGGVTGGPGAIALQSNGEILVAGSTEATRFSQSLFGVARLASNGEFDTTFGSGGTLTTSFAGAAGVDALLIQTDGKIVAVGGMIDPQNRNIDDLVMARYLGN